MKIRTLLLALALLLAPQLVLADAEPWIHIRVDDPRVEEHVTVNVPLSLARVAARALDDSSIRADVDIEFDDADLTMEELREIWAELRDAPNATLVTVESREEHVAVRKDGDWILVETLEATDRGARVDVRIPAAVIEALLADPDRLDLEGAIVALAAHTRGPVISVRDGDETVEIWIDEEPEANGRRSPEAGR